MGDGERRTTRERRLARADRLEGWSEGNAAKADAAHAVSDRIAGMIPFGQPILVGHHSERRHRRDLDRMRSAMDRGVELAGRAEDQARRAASIRAQADASIYDDDPDAVARLEERIAGLEARRERVKAYNRSARAAVKRGESTGDLSLLDDADRSDLLSTLRVAPYMVRNGQMPAFVLSNLGGRISEGRARLARLRRAGGAS